MQSVKTFLCSCEIYLDSLQINQPGYYTIVWYKGKRHTESARHQLEQEPDQQKIYLNETLKMNLKLYLKSDHKNNQIFQQKKTHLFIIDPRNQEQICGFELKVNEWDEDFNRVALNIKNREIQGKLVVKWRRSIIMELDGFQRFAGEIQESDEQIGDNNLEYPREKIEPELIRLQKQLEDNAYLIQKLKNDRNTTLARNQFLERQIKIIKKNINAEMKRMEAHYMTKMENRESIYRQEIQEIVSTFNSNFQSNKAIMLTLVQENQKVYQELVETRFQLQKVIQEEREFFQSREQQLENEKEQLFNNITDLKSRLQNSEEQCNKLRSQLANQISSYKQLQRKKNEQKQRYEKEIKQMKQENEGLEENIESLKKQIEEHMEDIRSKKQEIDNLKQIQNDLRREIDMKDIELEKQKNEKQIAINDRDTLKIQFDNEKQRAEDFSKLQENSIKDYQRRQQENQLNYQKIMKEHNETIQGLHNEITQLHEQSTNQLNRNTELEVQLIKKNDEIQNLKNQIQNFAKATEQERKQLTDAFDQDAAELKQKLLAYQQERNMLQEEVQKIEKFQELRYQEIREDFQREKEKFQQQKQEQYRLRFQQLKDIIDNNQIQSNIKNQQLNRQNQQLRYEIEKLQQDANQKFAQLEAIIEKKEEQILRLDEEKHYFEMENKYKNLQGQQATLAVPKQEGYESEQSETHKEYLEEIQKLQSMLNVERQCNLKEKEEIQNQWEKIREAQQELLLERQEFKSQILTKKKNVLNPNQYLSVPVTKIKSSDDSSIALEIPKDSIDEDFKGSIRQLKKDLEELTFLGQQRDLDEQRSLFMKKIDQLQKQLLFLDDINTKKDIEIENINEKFYLQQLQINKKEEENMILADKLLIQSNDLDRLLKEGELLKRKASENEKQIERLELQLEEAYFDMQTKKQFKGFNQSKIDFDEGSLDRVNSDQQLRSSIQSFIKNKKSKTSLQNKQVQTEIPINQSNDPKCQQISFHDLQLTSSLQPSLIGESRRQSITEKQKIGQHNIQDSIRNSKKISPKMQQSFGNQQNFVIHQEEQQSLTMKERLFQLNKTESNRVPQPQFSDLRQANAYLKNVESELKTKLSEASEGLKSREDKIERLNKEILGLEKRNRQLFDELTLIKQQYKYKSELQDSKLAEIEQRDIQTKKSIALYDVQITNFKQKLSEREGREQQYKQQYQMKNMENQKLLSEIEQLKNQNQRYRNEIEALERKISAQNTFEFIKTVQNQLEDSNKKVLELTRTLNMAKIDKNSAQDELAVIKKKLMESEKSSQQKYQKLSDLQREFDDVSRKMKKFKLEKQDLYQQCQKLKDQAKRHQEQLHNFTSFNTTSYNDRKKVMQEKLQLEEELAKKDLHIRKLQKQIGRFKEQLEEDNENQLSKKSLREKEYERTIMQIQRVNKLLIEYEEENHRLVNKIQNLQASQRQQLENIRKNHSDKLRFYVQEISNIKNVRDQSDAEILHLKMENNQYEEQLVKLQKYLEEADGKVYQMTEYIKEIEYIMEQSKSEKDGLMKTLKGFEEQSSQMHKDIGQLKKEIQREKMISLKKSQKTEEYEILNEKYIYEIKNLKVRISEYETKSDITQSLSERLAEQQNYAENLIQEIANISKQFNAYKIEHAYGNSEVEAEMAALKQHFEESHENNIREVTEKLEVEFHEKNTNMEQEVLKLYNENAQYGILIQQKQEQILQLLTKIRELEPYKLKYESVIEQKQLLISQNDVIMNQSKILLKQKNHFESLLSETLRNLSQLKNEKQLRNQQYQMLSQENQKEKRLRAQAQNMLELISTEYQSIKKMSNEYNQSYNSQLQKLSGKILASELENERVKQREDNLSKEYRVKINSLESLLKKTKAQSKQNEIILTRKLEQEIENSQKRIKALQKQLQEAQSELKNNSQNIRTLTEENNELRGQLSNIRDTQAEDQELYIMEINNLKKNMSDMDELYNTNVQALEEELAALNRQLTNQRISRNEQLKGSHLRQSQVDRRNEERIRIKDQKIEQLKNEVFMLQEKLSNMKKQSEFVGVNQVTKLKQLLSEANKNLQIEHSLVQTEKNKNFEAIRNLKKQLILQKQAKENVEMALQQNSLALQSVQVELKTIKQLYETLQQQISRRKDSLGGEIQAKDVLRKQLDHATARNLQLEQICKQASLKIDELSQSLHVKQKQILSVNEELSSIKLQNSKAANYYKQTVNWQEKQRKYLKELETKVEILEKQERKLRIENQGLQQQLLLSNESRLNMEKEVRETQQKLRRITKSLSQLRNKYELINEKCLQKNGYEVEQFIMNDIFTEKLIRQDHALQIMQQELEEVKFLQNQKLLDYESTKREKIEMEIKLEQLNEMAQQVYNLQRICDKLEEQKNHGILRENALRERLANMMNHTQRDSSMRESMSQAAQNVYV